MLDVRARLAAPAGACDGTPARPRTDRGAVHLEIIERFHPMRAHAERFIHDRFARVYGADVRHFFPSLLTLRDTDECLIAALGFQAAVADRLFLEQYLDKPVEQAVAGALNRPCVRYTLVEVGNLAVIRAGGARLLITALTAFLTGAGFDWAVFTAVPALRNAFDRLGVDLIALARARSECLPPQERSLWGNYYETQPIVVAANVAQSFDALAMRMRANSDDRKLRRLWYAAHAAGLIDESQQDAPRRQVSARACSDASDRIAV